jgi:hypothetical protein
VYRDFKAFADNVCFSLLRKKMQRDSLLVRALVLALNPGVCQVD